jgi:hypothetical protein
MHSRNALLQRLRSLTRRIGIAVTVLTGVFAGLAAAGNSGHHRRAAPAPTRPRQRATNLARAVRIPPPPSLPPVGSDAPFGGQATAPPAPPTQPPAQTSQPPVAVSGGS